MKILIVLFAFCIHVLNCNYFPDIPKPVIYLPPEESEAVLNAIRKCCSERDSKDMIQYLHHGGFRLDPEFQRCTHCMYKESGYMSHDGKINILRSSSLFPDPNRMLNILTQCDMQGENHVEIAVKAFICYQKNVMCRIALKRPYSDIYNGLPKRMRF